VFRRIHDKGDYRIIMLRGGTRSSKSYSIMQVVVLWLYTGQIGGKHISKGVFTIARSTFPALRSTVMKDFINYLFELDIYKFIEHKKTVNEFNYAGRTVSFISTDDAHKLRGRQHTFCWLNEVNDMEFEIFNQVNMRLERWMYIDCNPSGHPWARTEIEEKMMIVHPEDVYLDVSVYTDNPFLPDAMIKQIINLKDIDHDLWSIYTLGVWTELKGLIYPKIEIVNFMPIGWKTYYGCDFGWNDPSVLVEVAIKGKDMYIDLLVHSPELLLDELADKMRTLRRSPKILCDSAEPRTIEELKRRGIKAKGAKKGADSVRQRIMFIKQHKIHVTSTSVELIDEWKKFKWDEDKDGHITDKPINLYKHCSDAVSYAISVAMQQTVTLLN
jgi:phage terminase large subunit